MLAILDRFCDAYDEWDRRSNVGDVYLTPIMQYLGGHARRGIPSDELGEYRVEVFTFTAPSKSRLGFDLLSAINGGRLKLYQPDGEADTNE